MTQLEALKAIAQKNGGMLRPQDVVNESRPEDAPLHNSFEWDDSVAGEKYRIIQAQEIIRCQVVVISEDKEPIRAFVSLSTDRGIENGGYRLTTTVLSDSDMTEQMKQDAAAEFESFSQKYARISELDPVFKLGKEFVKKHKKIA